jgi:hypothetical protein
MPIRVIIHKNHCNIQQKTQIIPKKLGDTLLVALKGTKPNNLLSHTFDYTGKKPCVKKKMVHDRF